MRPLRTSQHTRWKYVELPLLRSCLQDDLVFAHGLHQGTALVNGIGQRFFEIDALARARRVEGDGRMREIRSADDHAIDVIAT